MTSENENISASADDCEESNFGVVNTSGTQITLNSQNWGGGFRFQNVDVAQGTQIDSATLTMYGSTTCGATGNCHTTIYGVDADDTSAWGSGNKPSSQTKTTASTSFVETGDFTPDLDYLTFSKDVTTIVQEILDRGSWASGNSMSFVIDCDSFGKSQAIFISAYDNGGYPPPAELEIVWTVAGTQFKINIGDSWKNVSAMQINIGDTWKPVSSAKINIGDDWKTIF